MTTALGLTEMKDKTKLKEIIWICLTIAVITGIGSWLLYADQKREGTFGEDYIYTEADPSAVRSVPTPSPEPTAEPVAEENKVELNTATKEELMTLPGVGEGLADRIIAQREKMPYKQPRDLKKVSGIGDKKFKKIYPYIYVQESSAAE